MYTYKHDCHYDPYPPCPGEAPPSSRRIPSNCLGTSPCDKPGMPYPVPGHGGPHCDDSWHYHDPRCNADGWYARDCDCHHEHHHHHGCEPVHYHPWAEHDRPPKTPTAPACVPLHPMGRCYPPSRSFIMPPGQLIIPSVYDESLSVAQQVAKVFGYLRTLDEDKWSKDEFSDFYDWLTGVLEQRRLDVREGLHQAVADLRAYIDTWSGHETDHDVTTGAEVFDATAATRLFNDLAVHGTTVDALAESDYTVDTLAECGLNVRGLAVDVSSVNTDSVKLPVDDGFTYTPMPDPDNLTVRQLAMADVVDGFFKLDQNAANVTVADLKGATTEDDFIKDREG